MSRSKVHVLIPHTTEAACGAAHIGSNAGYREQVTCRLCRESDYFKQLPNRPRKNTKSRNP